MNDATTLRTVGKSDLRVSPLCLGGNVFGWTTDEAESKAVLDAYAEAGGNFIDTADVYSTWVEGHTGGESEKILGRWMSSRGNRADIVLITKVGSEMSPEDKGLSKQHIYKGVEDSLRRLQTDHIDLYFAHRDDPAAPLEETLEAFTHLVEQGKVRYIGASNYTAERLAEASQISKVRGCSQYVCLQPPYNLAKRDVYEGALEDYCKAEGLGVITYSSLASGFLTGKYRRGQEMPKSARATGVERNYMHDKGFAVLDAVERVAKARGATNSQVALAWLMQHPGITAPIASATSADQVRELMGAIDLHLSNEEIVMLEEPGN
jgi:aryl-alcohol dehydrogenase-like predicted oxidoreductase